MFDITKEEAAPGVDAGVVVGVSVEVEVVVDEEVEADVEVGGMGSVSIIGPRKYSSKMSSQKAALSAIGLVFLSTMSRPNDM